MDVYDETFPSGGAEFQRRIRYCMYMYTVHLWVEEHFLGFVLLAVLLDDRSTRRAAAAELRLSGP